MMKGKRKILRRGMRIGVVTLIMFALMSSSAPPTFIQATGGQQNFVKFNEPPFDFSDEFYLVNGINPDNILRRPGNPDRNPNHWIEDNSVTDPTRRGIRILETTGGWDRDGNLIYYSIMGDVVPETFTDDAAGVRARMLAEDFRAFLFPKTERDDEGNPINVKLSPAPPNRRQDNVFDTKNAYFCENLLGLWIVTFVVYTKKAYNALFRNGDPNARRVLEALIARNGRDLDGTPILNTVADIERLERMGLVELRFNPEVGGDGPRWVI